jgi:hypothetical protein
MMQSFPDGVRFGQRVPGLHALDPGVAERLQRSGGQGFGQDQAGDAAVKGSGHPDLNGQYDCGQERHRGHVDVGDGDDPGALARRELRRLGSALSRRPPHWG